MNAYAVDVAISNHDLLKEGVVELAWFRVLVSPSEASSDSEAILVAAQIAATTFGMCTSARLVDWPS